MSISRRNALKLAGAGAALLGLPSRALAVLADRALYPPEGMVVWPVLQGPTDRHSASFILVLPHRYPFDIRVRGAAGEALPWRVADRMEMPELGLATTEIVASGLSPGRDYRLELLDTGGNVFDRRIFRALDTSRTGCRFAVASCMYDGFTRHATTMWEAMAREECDFVVLLGDTCYADIRNSAHEEAGYLRRYTETRLSLSWFKMERLTPTLAVWDDHDFGADNADRTFAGAAFNRRLFRAFWGAADNSAWIKTFGVGSRFEAFGQRFYLLDDRSYRDPKGTPHGRHWGHEQTDWFTADIARNSRPAWLMNGSQFFGSRLIMEQVETDHPDDLRDINARLARLPAPVAFVSGDVHFSEIERIGPEILGYETRQFTSSAIHSAPHFGAFSAFDPDILAMTRRQNFLVFNVETAGGWRIDCRSVLEGNREAFATTALIGR